MRCKTVSLVRGCAMLVVGLVALAAQASELKVPDYGVGAEVIDRELSGRAERFDEGSQVWFWTRVVGAEPGDGIRHVWIHDGQERATVELDVDGSPWRTYSAKKLHPGSVGSWTVEARDREGNVLARQTFECAAAQREPSDPPQGDDGR